jgi:TolA-binding protein
MSHLIKNVLFVILLTVFAIACTSKKEKLAKSIYKMEISDSSYTPKGMNELANMYFDYAQSFTKDSISERYLFKAFMFKYITGNWDDALKFANYYKSTYAVSENYYSINLKLADLYNTGKKNQDSAVYYYLVSDGKAQFSTDEKRKAAGILEKWALAKPTKAKAASALYTGGKLYQMANDFTESVRLYSEVANKYPDYEKSPDALQAAGFICWNNLKDIEKAKLYYKQLVDKYPTNPLAKEAQTLLSENILTMSDLELSEYLMKKNKEKAQ